jgi:hypothetical protein
MKRDLETLLKNTKEVNDCLEWQGCLNTDGYARALIDGNANAKVHRVMFQLTNPEENIDGLLVRHSCDNPRCINPQHLLKGTPKENGHDKFLRGRQPKKLTKEIILRVKQLLDIGVLNQKEISQALGIDPRRISEINCNHFNDEGKKLRHR